MRNLPDMVSLLSLMVCVISQMTGQKVIVSPPSTVITWPVM